MAIGKTSPREGEGLLESSLWRAWMTDWTDSWTSGTAGDRELAFS